MKGLVKSLIATGWALAVVCGCSRAPTIPNVGGGGVITWAPAAGKDKSLPGIDGGSVYHLGTAFVLWSDTSGGGGGQENTHMQGIRLRGSLVAGAGRIEFGCDTADGKSGQVSVNGATYELADGNLFLVATGGEKPQVKQLKRDLSELKFERESLAAFARNDPEIAGFFAGAAKGK
jgi:hypothetical protein